MEIRKEFLSFFSRIVANIDFGDYALNIPIVPMSKRDDWYVYEPILLIAGKQHPYTSKDVSRIVYTIVPQKNDKMIFTEEGRQILNETEIVLKPDETKFIFNFLSATPYIFDNDARLKLKVEVWHLSTHAVVKNYIILLPLQPGREPMYQFAPNVRAAEKILEIVDPYIIYNIYQE